MSASACRQVFRDYTTNITSYISWSLHETAQPIFLFLFENFKDIICVM